MLVWLSYFSQESLEVVSIDMGVGCEVKSGELLLGFVDRLALVDSWTG